MKLSIKEIKSKFDKRLIRITSMGWVESQGHLLGRLFKDPCTSKIYFRSNVGSSNTQVRLYRKDFLANFRYTQQLRWYNRYFSVFGYVVELHGFRKDM